MKKPSLLATILVPYIAFSTAAFAQDAPIPPLIEAIRARDAEKVAALVARGADVNAAHEDTALVEAIDQDPGRFDMRIAKTLLSAPAIDVNKRSVRPMGAYSWSRTPLIAAAYRGNAELVRLLLDKGAKVDLTDQYLPANPVTGPEPLNTALIYAAQGGFYDVALLLLDRGADIEKLSALGRTPLIAAADSVGKDGPAAARANNAKVLGLLLDRGAKVDSCPLTPNAKYAQLDLPASVPASVPRQVRIRGYGGITALSLAAKNGFIEGAKVLLDKGANLEARGLDYKETALILAASANQTAMVDFLLDRGADIEASDVTGLTPLLAAAPGLFYDTVATLLKRGAKVDAAYITSGATALMQAINIGPPEKEGESLRLMRLLIDKGADVNFQGIAGNTALMYASGWGVVPKSPARAKLLLEKGAKVGLVNRLGETALMHAANRGYAEISKLLLSRGAEVNAKALDGRTALMNAAAATMDLKGANGEFAQLVKLLLDAGADVDAKDAKGDTALSLATRNKRAQAVAYLSAKGAKAAAPAAPDAAVAPVSIVGAWEGLKNQNPYESHRFVFKADGSWTYEAGLSAAFKKEYPAADLQQGYAANIKSQAAMIGTKGKYSFRDQYLILKPDSGFGVEKVMAWEVKDGTLRLNGIEFVLKKAPK